MNAGSKAQGKRRKQYTWHFRAPLEDLAAGLQSQMKLNAAVARVLANRGFGRDQDEVHQFINPSLGSLHDPFLMRDMDVAVDRVVAAQRNREPIVVYGDYDTDGTTSTALLLRVFDFLEMPASYYIPHRIEEGYGMNCQSLETLAARGNKLIVTVDNGVCCLEEVARAQELGMDIIVTDHHQPTSELPRAIAVVNPSRHDCTYPNKYLTGVGVAFKFAHALLKRMDIPQKKAVPLLRSMLDLVALGTIADFAPVTGENRVLVRHGLDQIQNTTNVGIQELKRLLEMNGSRITTHKIGFQIAPRLNAAGRTNSAHHCVELLTTSDRQKAADIANQLDGFNRERRNVETTIFEQCLRFVEDRVDLANERILVVNGPGWHVGVIGIVASRLMELFDRPVIVLSEMDGHAKGSARSIKNFNIHQALTHCRDYIITFGGHPNAAGLQLQSENVEPFRRAINEYASELLKDDDLQPSIMIDTPVEGHEIDFELLRDLQALEPHGPSNPHPIFSASNLKLTRQPRIVGNNHLRLCLAAGGRSFNAIGFNLGDHAQELACTKDVRFDAAFCPCLNSYGTQQSVEWDLKDIKIRSGA